MKFKCDFVTNSSSSSYIAVFAKINNANAHKAMKIVKKYNLYDCLMEGSEILEKMKSRWFCELGADWAGVDLTPDKSEIEENAKYIFWEECGGAGDGDYAFDTSGNGDMNYDVDVSDFRDEEQEIFDAINKDNGFENIEKGYGAGRNG
ncbi:MAG TPA: hypothetical protein VFK73_05855 [Paludibacter sp.]|nr:hypothetical protein [Paludibacter sp.]